MDIFSALAEPNRRQIIELLSTHGQLSASDIGKKFHVSAPAISQHLKILREAELVQMEKKAQQRLYQINPDKLSEIEIWVKQLKNLWDARFDNLDKVLAKEQKKGGGK